MKSGEYGTESRISSFHDCDQFHHYLTNTSLFRNSISDFLEKTLQFRSRMVRTSPHTAITTATHSIVSGSKPGLLRFAANT